MMNFSIAKCLFSIGGCTTILGNISADTAVSSAGAIGGLGVLTIAVNYTRNLLKKKDEQWMAKDARIVTNGNYVAIVIAGIANPDYAPIDTALETALNF